MNALSRNRLTAKQLKLVENECNAFKNQWELAATMKAIYISDLAMCITAEKLLGFGKKRRARFLNAYAKEMLELTDWMNECSYTDPDGKEHCDREYILEKFKRLSEQYGIEFNEHIFD